MKKSYDSKFKSRVALEALRGDLTVAEIAGKYQIHPNKDEIMDIFYDTPFYGVPRLTAELKRRGFNINHKRVRRLQKALGLRTIYPRPHFNTSYVWFRLAY